MRVPIITNEISARAPFSPPRANPEAMAAPWDALARGAGELSDQMASFNERYQHARLEADASARLADTSEKLGDAQFRWSKTPDRQEALKGFSEEAKSLKTRALDGINDPIAKSLISQQFDKEATIRYLDTGNTAFALESSTRRGELDESLANYAQSSATSSNEYLRAQISDNANGAIGSAVTAGWLSPEAGAQKVLKFRSDIQMVGVRQAMNAALDSEDPDAVDHLVRRLNDPKEFPGLVPEEREVLQRQAEVLSNRLTTRIAARDARADAIAERELKRTQSVNETLLLSQIYDPTKTPPDAAALERMALGQQISPGGLEAIHAAMDRRTAGQDDPVAAAHLWAAIGDKTATRDDVYDALNAHRVRGETAAEMMKALSARGSQDTNAVERGYFNQLRTAMGGGAIETGMLDFTDTKKVAEVQLWAQAQGEWNRRVLSGKEDPHAVLADMLPRYVAARGATPGFGKPLMGDITTPAQLEDVRKKTANAYRNKTIDEATFQSQAELLNLYRSFFAAQSASNVVPFAKTNERKPALDLGEKK